MRKSILWIVFVCLLVSIQSSAQNQQLIDSLKHILSTQKAARVQVDVLNQIAIAYDNSYIDSTVFYAQSALEQAKAQNYTSGAAYSHNYLARAFVEKNNFPSAIDNYHSALKLFIDQKDSVMILNTYRGLSYVYSYSLNQMTSLSFNMKALNIAQALKDTNSLSILYNNLAVSYLKIGNYKSSRFYFNKTIELDQILNIPHNTAVSYSNFGVLNLRDHKPKEAEKNYIEVIKFVNQVESVYVKSYLYISLVKYFLESGQYQTSLLYADSAMFLCEAYEFDHIKVRLYRRLGELKIKQELYREGLQYLDSCLTLSAQIGVEEAIPEIYSLKAKAYSKLQLFDQAYQAMEMSQIMTDSLKTNEIALVLGEYEEEQRTKNELKRQQLEKDLIEQRMENNRIKMMLRFRYAIIVIVLLLIIVVIGLYIFYQLRNKNQLLEKQHLLINEQKEQLENHNQLLKKSEERLQQLNATKDKFFSIIAHDLKSPFNAIIGYSEELRNSYDDYDDVEKKLMIQQIRKSSGRTLKLLENLLNWAQSQSGFIELSFKNTNLLQVTKHSISAYIAAASLKNLKIDIRVDSKLTAWCDEETIKIIISNLFNNAIKFSNENDSIILSATEQGNDVIYCIQDFGMGMPKEILNDLFKIETNVQRSGTSNEKGTGLGLILCHEFVLKNKGKIWAESEEGKGSKFFFTLPLQSQLL